MTGSIPQPLDFLDAISGHLQRERTSSADRPVRLATVDPAYDPFASPGYPDVMPAARVTFDGEDTLSGKAYPVAQGVIPRAGQRVFMIPQGNGYLLAGGVNPQTPQGFWADPDGTDYGVELGGGNYWDNVDGLYLETDATINGALTLAGRPAASAPPVKLGKLHWDIYTVNTDASGFATITHGAGFTPTFVLVGQWGTSGASGVHILYSANSASATTFQVKVQTATGTLFAAGTVIGVCALLAA